jgi:hypothetical protein
MRSWHDPTHDARAGTPYAEHAVDVFAMTTGEPRFNPSDGGMHEESLPSFLGRTSGDLAVVNSTAALSCEADAVHGRVGTRDI